MPTYDIAISFSGEDRPIAEKLASLLVTKGLNVFYDEYEQANLWGKDLYVHLSKIYKDEAKYCLMLVSEHYAKKQWTNHERRAAQARAFAENSEYILPLRLDDAQVDGILDTVGFLDYARSQRKRLPIPLSIRFASTTTRTASRMTLSGSKISLLCKPLDQKAADLLKTVTCELHVQHAAPSSCYPKLCCR